MQTVAPWVKIRSNYDFANKAAAMMLSHIHVLHGLPAEISRQF